MDISYIITLSRKELYDRALIYKENKNYDGYCIYIIMSANLNYKLAQSELSDAYNNQSIHLKQNHSVTLKFYEATQQYGYSLHYLGHMYHYGLGVKKDFKKAKELYEKAIDKGNHHAICDMGLMYEKGYGVKQDYIKAKELYEIAGALNNSSALSNLGILYELNLILSPNYQNNPSKELFEKSIELGNASAMNNLANIYYTGHNIAKNIIKARELYEMAIAKGNTVAITNLCILYRKTDLKNDAEYVINYFKKINREDLLKEIYDRSLKKEKSNLSFNNLKSYLKNNSNGYELID